MKQEVRSKGLKLDLRFEVRSKGLESDLRFEVKSEVRTKEVLNLRLGAKVREQAMDK